MKRILIGGLVVGILDITEVIIFYAFRGISPMRILQSVARGLYGQDAFTGGVRTAIIGLALHFFIAFCVVATYYAVSRRVTALRTHPFIAGAIYGVLVYLFMNFVVLPLSAVGPPKFTTVGVANQLFAHLFCIGIPAALFASVHPERAT